MPRMGREPPSEPGTKRKIFTTLGRWNCGCSKSRGRPREGKSTGVLAVAESNWVYIGERVAKKPPPFERAATAAACDKFIAEVLKPRFLPEIRPSEFNYPISIYGKWHGSKYRFITRYRSDNPRFLQAEFEARLPA